MQVYVSRLRRALGEEELLTTSRAGYRLRVRPGELDLEHFERLVEEGRRALAETRAAAASELLQDALGSWRGPALADLAFESFAQPEIARLEELRQAAVEVRIEADLAAGRQIELVPELQRLVDEHPLHERPHGQLMLALYRSGRQAEALDVYRDARRVLVEQLGLEPKAELQWLQQAILAHDPAVQAPPSAPDSSGASARRVPNARAGRGLPPLSNRTIGRMREVGAVAELLLSDWVHLLTLTGPGGVGKTRLALESARAVEAAFADGARFVSLGAVERPEDVPAALLATLELTPMAGESADRTVERCLAHKHLLLVLDNFEHLLAAAPLVAVLLARCRDLTVLATSRAPLNVTAESVSSSVAGLLGLVVEGGGQRPAVRPIGVAHGKDVRLGV